MSTTTSNTALTRTHSPAPVRLVHLGLGAFHRSHQVWYTEQANQAHPDDQWGYASFTGRSARMSDLLSSQDNLYTLVVRSGEGDDPQLIESLVETQPAANIARLAELIASPEVAVVTLTVTEAGYHLASGLKLDTDSADVAADIEALKAALAEDGSFNAVDSLATAAGRIVYGLGVRRAAGLGGIAVMSCDNISANGATTCAAVLGLASAVDEELASWIKDTVTFPSTSIDRITPATTDELIAEVEKTTGYHDGAPVVTEPFASWVIEGDFPAGRPEWEVAGAQFVDDIEQFENRKLWLLNGSHSLMAYFGQLRGHATVAEAIVDPEVRTRVENLWDEAAQHLTAEGLNIPEYRTQLIERFENPRIRHNLAQIAIDGATKQRMRALAIATAERNAGRSGEAALFSIAGWIAFCLANEDIKDTRADEIAQAKKADEPIRALIAVLDEELAADAEAVSIVSDFVSQIS